MQLLKAAAAAGAAAVLAAITGCGSSSSHVSGTSAGGTPPASTSAVSGPAQAASATTVSPTTGDPSFVNGGAALGDTGNLVTVLEAVNPRIGTNMDDLVAKSKTLCSHINAQEPMSQLDAHAAKSFSNGSWVPSTAEAEAIVATVKAYGGC